MRRSLTIAAAVAALVVVAASVPAAADQSELTAESIVAVNEAPDRVQGPRRAIIISDSAMAGVRWNGALPGLRGFNPDDRLESCRRLVDRSCRGREGRRPLTALAEINLLAPALPRDVLVVAVGYNDYDSRFATHARMVLNAAVAKGFRTVAWVTYREDVSYRLPRDTNRAISNYRNMNAELRSIVASGAYPALQLWDLNAYTVGVRHWFTSDGVHQTPFGSWGVADWISRKMAAIDGRHCPMPWMPGSPRDYPCPDPNGLIWERGYPAIGALYGS